MQLIEEEAQMRISKTRVIAVLLLIASSVIAGQSRRFSRDDIEFILDLPSPAWRAVSRVDVHNHPDFINGSDPTNGYLRLRKIFTNQPSTASELFRQQETLELQRLPGYMVCSECDGVQFNGRLPGTVFSYEYVNGGKTMYGRIYYLQIDQRAFYSLHFTVARDRLSVTREDMDSIARSFYLK